MITRIINNGILLNGARDLDPTRTIMLRRKFALAMRKRFNRVKSLIITSINKNDCFGLKTLEDGDANLFPIPYGKFQYKRDYQKIEEFLLWLQEMIERGILDVGYGENMLSGTTPWTNIYIRSAYIRGIVQARQDLKNAGISGISTEEEAITTAFNSFANVERVALIYTRTFNELEGVTDAMSTQISRVLSEGIATGQSPYTMAKKIADRVDKIGISRAELISRTETIYAFNNATLMEYEAASRFIGEEIKTRWWTALDERVRAAHRLRHGKVYTLEEASKLIGEPNCRCCLLPVLKGRENL